MRTSFCFHTKNPMTQASSAGSAASYDWAATALGPLGGWPHTLRLAADILLNSPIPMLLVWGDDAATLYNPAYAELAGLPAPGSAQPGGTPPPLAACPDGYARARQGEPVQTGLQVLSFGAAGERRIACNLAMTPLRDEHGVVKGVLCTLNDCAAAEAAPAAAPASLRILVVEDNLDSQYLVCEMLKAFGHDAAGVADGESALGLLRAGRYEVLFSDVSLPGISGVELARQALVMQPELRVIFASGYGDTMLRHLDFPYLSLQKPYEMDQLQNALDAIARQVQG